ncbi:hypothetical protein Y900_001580 [Mycolicibacterium aromaticivorans JS19b1 = JCM 16368]|uniref:Uncharacterized protein n=1 Tax=Mycolicibacterium aromaticivorans JS19b1 = JCM 16368 TaxID=1440774 RepID=A0A064CFW9_9MYCO|nr:hypothetical protein [Mycolicibacterium aromaticivorans]KDE97657.1 hypothetical protein Y900_001580 [Mycolicibacterium aromaticivorans JS19b1 = JCM 16368]
MGLIFRLVELLLVIVPLAGAIYAAVKGVSAIRRQNEPVTEPPTAVRDNVKSQAAQWRTITRVIDEHNRTDARWLEYELDAAKLLDFPAMTDMRDPLTVAFHRAKLRADLVRPGKAEDLLDDGEAARQYLDAVEAYVTAFEAAENEARRRRRGDFSRQDQQRLTRAQSLLRVAADRGATPQERERAYDLARGELDGLLVLPDRTTAALERGIAGELDD